MFIFLVQSLLIKSEYIFLQLGILKIYQKGLINGIILGFSVMNIAGVLLWVFQTTTNKEIARALDDSGVNHMLTYMFISSLQMIRVLGRNSRTIINAQQARGVETEGNLLIRARAFFPILVPLILGSVTGAEERALALESKGFDIKGERTHIFELVRSPWDTPVKVISWTAAAGVIAWRVLAWVL